MRCPGRLQSHIQRLVFGACQLLQVLDCGFVSFLQQQPLGGVALPAVRRLNPAGRGFGFFRRTNDAVNAPHLFTGAQIQALGDVGRNPLRMLQDEAIHVHNVQRAIGSGARHAWAEPVVGTGDELAARVLRMAVAGDRQPGVIEHLTMHEIVRRFTNEQEFFMPVMPWDRRAAGGQGVGRAGPVETAQRRTDGIHGLLVIEGGAHGLHHALRMFFQIAHRQVIVPADDAVVVAEPVAIIIPPLAILAASGLDLKLTGHGMKAEVIGGELDLFSCFLHHDVAAAVAVGTVEPAVESPAETIDEMLRIAGGETGEPCFTLIALAIAIRVFGIKNIRNAGDKDSAFPEGEPGRVLEAIEKERGLVINGVAIGILKDLDAAVLQVGDFALTGFAIVGFFTGREGVVAHLHHPHSAACIPVHIHGILHQGFMRHEFDLVARLHLNGLE